VERGARGEEHLRPETSSGGRRWSQGASQRTWRLPPRHLLARVIDAIRMVPGGHGACGVTVPGSRCKSFVLPVRCWERVPSLPLLVPRVRDEVQRKHLRNCKLQYTYNNTEQGAVKAFNRIVVIAPCRLPCTWATPPPPSTSRTSSNSSLVRNAGVQRQCLWRGKESQFS
jgi:hypothetical protein